MGVVRLLSSLSFAPLPCISLYHLSLQIVSSSPLLLNAPASDEVLVRLMVLAEGGGLPMLSTATLWGDVSDGAVLFLLLWLKRQTTWALRGQGAVALWDVHLCTWSVNRKRKCLEDLQAKVIAQIKEARERL